MKIFLNSASSRLFFFLLFICSSCGLDYTLIYEGPTITAQKLHKALKDEGILVIIDTDTNKKSSNISVKLDSIEYSNRVLSVLRPIVELECDTGLKSISRYFIPRKVSTNTPSANITDLSSKLTVLIHYIEALPHVIHVSCDYGDDTKGASVNLKVWSSSQSDLELLKKRLEEINVVLGYDHNIEYSHVNLSEVLSNTNESTSLPKLTSFHEKEGNLILFEPFRFHVLEREKVSAGFQFIIMLTLFLVSGFTIGFWWARRYNDKE